MPAHQDFSFPTHQPLFPEVNAHSGDELLLEDSLSVVVEEAGLAHPRVPQSQELYQVVIIFATATHLPWKEWKLILLEEGIEIKDKINSQVGVLTFQGSHLSK